MFVMQILVVLHMVSTLTTMDPHSDSFGNAIITKVHSAWRVYLVGVKCHIMQSYVFCDFRMHDPFANASRMRSVLCCKWKFILVLRIFGILPLLVIFFVANLAMWHGLLQKNTSLRLAVKVDRPLCFYVTSLPHLHIMYQMCRHVFFR